MKEIVQDGAPVLREIARPVPDAMFGTSELTEFLTDMTDALDQEPDGVALAAPQVGESLRIFIVRMDRVEPPQNPSSREGSGLLGEPSPKGEPPAIPEVLASSRPAVVDTYINPEITKTSRRRSHADEGCLSVRGFYGTTYRHERVTIRARRPDGTHFTRGAGGLLAQIFEHEIDHLNGVLFTDDAENLVHVEHHHDEQPEEA